MRRDGASRVQRDPKFEVLNTRIQHQAELIGYIEDWLKQYDDIDLPLAMLEKAGVPSCKVYSNSDVFADPHYRENDWLIEAPSCPAFPAWTPLSPGDRTPNFPNSRAPSAGADLGEHNYEIMERYGLSGEEVDRLQASGQSLRKGSGLMRGLIQMTEQQCELVGMIRDFMNKEVKPHIREFEEQGYYPDRLVQMGRRWLTVMQVPEAYGGLGLDTTTTAMMLEEGAKVESTYMGMFNITNRAQRSS